MVLHKPDNTTTIHVCVTQLQKRPSKSKRMSYLSIRILASSLVSLIAATMVGLAIADPLIFAAWIVWPAVIVSIATLGLTGYWFSKQELSKASVLAIILAGLAIPTLLSGAYSAMSSTSIVIDDTTIIAPAPAEENPVAADPGSTNLPSANLK